MDEKRSAETVQNSNKTEDEENVSEHSSISASSEETSDSDMEATLAPPPPLLFEGNIKENWKKWRQRFELYLKASGLDSKPAERQVAVLLHVIGPEALDKYNTFDLADDKKFVLKEVINAFEQYCTPKANETVERHIFFTCSQHEGETFDSFLTDLKKLSLSCGFDTLRDSLIKDRIVCGILNSSLRTRLLREDNLDLENCVKLCKAAELAELQLKTVSSEEKVHTIKTKQNSKNYTTRNNDTNQKSRISRQSSNTLLHKEADSKYKKNPCQKCGMHHKKYECPAYNEICKKCSKPNHFAKMCKNRDSKNKNVNFIEESDDFYDESEELFCGCVNSINSINQDWNIKLNLQRGKHIIAKLDTGAQCNVMPSYVYEKLNKEKFKLNKSCIKLSNYTGTYMRVLGKINLICNLANKKNIEIEFQVVDGNENTPTVLGLPTIINLELIQRINSIIKQNSSQIVPSTHELIRIYDNLFSGQGLITNFEYNIELKENSKGRIDACRRVPITLLKPLKKEIDRMLKMGIIKKVNEPTEWVNSLVITKKKDGSLRLCLDPQHLNQSIRKKSSKIKTFSEICARMAGAKYFTTLDANRAFWQVKLSENSSFYTTFNTPFGRYRFLVMPYGIITASETYEEASEDVFGDIEGVEQYIDDMIVWGRTEQEHDKRLRDVFCRAQQRNIRFNKAKCQFGATKVKYLGHEFSEKGIEPDHEKIKAILDMPKPTNVKELDTFLGMVTYLSKFVPNLSQINSALRNLKKRILNGFGMQTQIRRMKP